MLIELNGITLGYADEGRGLAVVLLHAFPLSRAMWQTTVEALRDRYRIITPDLRGLGDSSPTAGPALLSDMSDDVIGLLNALAVERAVFGGLSMGGYVTLDLLRRYPQRVAGLILADTRSGADDDKGKQNRAALAQKALDEGAGAVAEQMLPKLLSEQARAQKPDLVATVRAMIEANSPQGIAAASHGMAVRVDSTPLLPQVTAPTLVLVGAEDGVTPPTESQAMAQSIPEASLEIIADAGHLSNLEQPQIFNRALRVFLDRLG